MRYITAYIDLIEIPIDTKHIKLSFYADPSNIQIVQSDEI